MKTVSRQAQIIHDIGQDSHQAFMADTKGHDADPVAIEPHRAAQPDSFAS